MFGGYDSDGRYHFRSAKRSMDWKRRLEHRRVQVQKQTVQGVDPVLAARQGRLLPVADVFRPDRLFELYSFCEKYRGYAPGIDELTWIDFSHAAIRQLCDLIPEVVKDRVYKPQPYRSVKILKRDGKMRELKLRVIADRLGATATNEVLALFLDPGFDDGSCGYRERRSHWHMIASIERRVHDGYYVIAQDDVKGAFDHVRISDVMGILRAYPLPEDWLWLVETILRGHDGHQDGIDQGSALSPLMLNVLLDAIVDKPLRRISLYREHAATTAAPAQGEDEDRPLAAPLPSPLFPYRFADNLVVQVRTKTEGQWALNTLANLLRPYGLSLKGTPNGLVDLREHWTELLGFKLWVKNGTLHIGPGEDVWEDLKEGLLLAHNTGDPTSRAMDITKSWIEALGPTFGLRQSQVASRLLHVIGAAGFQLPISRDWALGQMELARSSYGKLVSDPERLPRDLQSVIQEDLVEIEATTLSCLQRNGEVPFQPSTPPSWRSDLGDGRDAAY